MMMAVKLLLIKLRFRLVSIIWIILKFGELKNQLKKKNIHDINIFMFNLWTSEVHFFSAQKESTDLFIKLYTSKEKNIREAEILLEMYGGGRCSYVPKFIEYILSNNEFILIVEKIYGIPLMATMNNLSFHAIDSIFEQFIEILDDLNNKSIVHCDIRPDNILITGGNKVSIIDFEYAVCKVNDNFKDLHFEKIAVLKNLGSIYAKGDYVWDDAFSFYKIACEIIAVNNYSEAELIKLSNKTGVLKMCIGKNQYAY